MAEKSRFLFEIMAIAAIFAVVDILIAFLTLVVLGDVSVFYIVSNLLFFEFAGMLVVGGCLMARQPLEDDKRYDDDGVPVASWRAALIGRKILGASIFTIILSILFLILGNYI